MICPVCRAPVVPSQLLPSPHPASPARSGASAHPPDGPPIDSRQDPGTGPLFDQSQLPQGGARQLPGSLGDHSGIPSDSGGALPGSREAHGGSGDRVKHKGRNRSDGGCCGTNSGCSSTYELPPDAMKALRAQQAVRSAAFERQKQQVLPSTTAFQHQQSDPSLLHITASLYCKYRLAA